jgi:hypothetical protein
MQLLLCFIYPLPILAIHDEYEALGTSVVVSPKRPDFVLPSYIPDIKFYILVRDGFHVETNCNGGVNEKELMGIVGKSTPVGMVVTD